jgi:pimeloyl-ACP methyl ester carboxylesterase
VTQVVKAPDERRLSIESLGDPKGKPVFLLHGTPGDRYGPRPRGIVLYRLGIRLITYDRPGYPGSDRLPDRRVANAADDVKAIADYLEIDRFSVVGRSGGAPHALACAALLNERVICAAALSSLAPYGAQGLDWQLGMADSNVRAYRGTESGLRVLIATVNTQSGQFRNNSEGLLKGFRPEIPGHDKEVTGDTALRQIITRSHAEALHETADGWIDDVIALSRPWGFELSTITVPVKLWGVSGDVFSPVSHTYWLAKRIAGAELEIAAGEGHFRAVGILPEILSWVAERGLSTQLATARTPDARRSAGPVYRSIVAVDLEGSTARTNPVKGELRRALYDLLARALAEAGIAARHLERLTDRGDGVLILIRPSDDLPKTVLLSKLMPILTGLLLQYNATVVRPALRMRLRVVVHAGEVHDDGNGFYGEDLDVAFRLLDSPSIKRTLREAPTSPLVLVISEEIFSVIVRQGYVEEGPYTRRVHVQVGERRRRGRVYVPNSGHRDQPAVTTIETTAVPLAVAAMNESSGQAITAGHPAVTETGGLLSGPGSPGAGRR